MKDSIVLRKNRNIVTREVEEETVLVPVYKTSDQLSCVYSLNEPATRVWKLIDGKRTLGEIKEKIGADFSSQPKEINRKMTLLLNDLKKIKAVIQK